MNRITDPNTRKQYSIFSKKGINIIRKYVKSLKLGSSEVERPSCEHLRRKGPKGKECHPNFPGCCLDQNNRDSCMWIPKKGHLHARCITKPLVVQQAPERLVNNGYIRRYSKLTEKKRRFCRCILHVAKNNSRICNITKNWSNKTKCYNPYSTCAKTVKTTTGGKPCDYMLKNSSIPIKEIIAFADLNFAKYEVWAEKNGRKSINDMNNQELRRNISDWYNSFYT